MKPAALVAQLAALDPTGRYRRLVAGAVALAVFACHQLGYCTDGQCVGGEALALLLGSLGFVRGPKAPADAPAPLLPAPTDEIPFGLLALAGLAVLLPAPAAPAAPLGPTPVGDPPGPGYRWATLPGVGYGWVHGFVAGAPSPAPAAAVLTPAVPPPAGAVDVPAGPAAAGLAADYEGADYEAPGLRAHGPGGEGDHPAEANGDGRPWPVRRLPYWIDWRGLGAVTPAQRAGVRAAFREAWGYWSARVAVDPVEVATEGEALVRHRFGPVDGPMGTLAWSYMADGTLRPKEQRYDVWEQWTTGPPAAGRLSLPTVAAHEIGHALGLGHDAATADALMRPSYSAAIPRPRPRDVDRLVRLGYDRR